MPNYGYEPDDEREFQQSSNYLQFVDESDFEQSDGTRELEEYEREQQFQVPSPSYNQYNTSLRFNCPDKLSLKQKLTNIDGGDIEEISWTIIECISEAKEMSDMTKACIGFLKLVRGSYVSHSEFQEIEREGLIPNPHFVYLGLPLALSPKTVKYLRNRKIKSAMGAAWTWGGAAVSPLVYGFDVGTASLSGQAVGLTTAHAVFLIKVRKKYKNQEFRNYVDVCLEAKTVKVVVRGVETTMALIPGASIAAKIGVAAGKAVFKIGAKITLNKAIDRTAQMLHLHAYLEKADRGAKPATEVIKEIFKRRGILNGFGLFNQYDVDTIINEPAGWMALADKLKLV